MTDTEADTNIGPVMADGYRETDTGNAYRFQAAAGEEIRYVHKWRKWLVYTNGVWEIDPGSVLVLEKAKRVSRALFKLAVQPGIDSSARDDLFAWAKKSESSAALKSMVTVAAGLDGMLVDYNDLEAKPELLNVENGTVNLRTGELLPFNPDDLLINQCHTIYDPYAECPLWMKCLERWQPDPQMRAYLQVCAGAAITGYPIQEFHVHHGSGANGKGRFFGVLMNILGPYAVIPDDSLLIQKKNDPHPTIVAHLYRSRLAVADETPEGAKLSEASVKRLTGGDRLNGRRMHEDPWEFDPTHLLLVRTNHIPKVRSADEAMRRRYRLIPWNVTIPDHERDETLEDRLLQEAPGILNWLIQGARYWLEHNRIIPKVQAVTDATNDMFRIADPRGYFLSIATVEGGDKRCTTKDIHDAYLAWRSDPSHDEEPKYFNNAEIGSFLRDRGYRRYRAESNGSSSSGWRGLDLTPAYRDFVEWVRINEPHRIRDTGPSGGFAFSWNPN